MNLIDRYISKRFLSYFLGATIVFLTLFVAVDALGLVVRYENVPLSTFARYYGFFIPEVFYQLIPVSCLMATILTISSLQKTNELVALYSSGMGLKRICAPIVFLVVLISLISFLVADQLLPSFAQNKNYIMYVEIRQKPQQYATVKTDRIWYRADNTLYNIKTLDATTQQAFGLTMYTFSESWRLLQMLTAERVEIKGDQWHLLDGSITLFSEDSNFPLTKDFSEKTIYVEQSLQDLQDNPHPTDVLSLDDLSRYIKKHKAAGLNTIRYEVDYHSKFGFAFAGIIMVLLGIPFSLGRARSGGIMLNLSLCLGVVFVYWSLYSSGLTLGYHGMLEPIVAAWAPNGICLAFGLFFVFRIQK